MKSAALKFYDFQPLDICSKLLIDLHAKNNLLGTSMSSDLFHHDKCEWINEFCSNNDSLKHLKLSSIPIDESVLLSLADDFGANIGSYNKNVLVDGFSSILVFDPKFIFFMLCIEVDILVNIEDDNLDLLERVDLYSLIRGLLVKDNKSKYQISAAANSVFNAAILLAKNILSPALNNDQDDCITIADNTGNIVCVYFDKNSESHNSFVHCLASANLESERLSTTFYPILLNGFSEANGVLYFNGRMHTLSIVNPEDKLRYIPVFYMMQFTWFYLKKLNRIMSDSNVFLENQNDHRGINSAYSYIEAITNKIEMLNLTNEIFKLDLEVDNQLIYEKVQEKWNIAQLMRQSNQFVVSFNGYVRRKIDYASLKSEKFKDSILVFISFVQLLALVSIWNDYLSLLNERGAFSYPDFLDSLGSLRWLNAYGPIFLLAMIFLVSAVFLIRRK